MDEKLILWKIYFENINFLTIEDNFLSFFENTRPPFFENEKWHKKKSTLIGCDIIVH